MFHSRSARTASRAVSHYCLGANHSARHSLEEGVAFSKQQQIGALRTDVKWHYTLLIKTSKQGFSAIPYPGKRETRAGTRVKKGPHPLKETENRL
jgi:hypothetical protein